MHKARENIDMDLLQDMLRYDIIQFEGVSEKIRTLKIEKALELHPYAITPPKDENGRWQTFVNVGTKRKKLAKTHLKDLHDCLILHYLKEENRNITLRKFYLEWVKKKEKSTKSMETLRRYNQYWLKYYIPNNIVDIPLRKLTKEIIEDYFHLIIKQYDMSKKEYNSMKIILKGSLVLAKEKSIIDYNPFLDIKIATNLCRHVPKKSNSSQIYFPDEQKRLFQVLENELKKDPTNTCYFGIMLLFMTGVRVGELVGLKWCDIEDGYLHVQRMEMKKSEIKELGVHTDGVNFTVPQNKVVPYVKTNNDCGDRYIYITEEAKNIINRIKYINCKSCFKDNEYILCGTKGRQTRRQIAYYIEKACIKADIIPIKSAHDIRRTYASVLFSKGVALDEVRKLLGHSDEKTTLSYIFNPYTPKETNDAIENALSSRSVLKCTQEVGCNKKAQTL